MNILLVQGIRTPLQKQSQNARELQAEINSQVEIIPNQSQGFVKDLLNASLGVLRHDWGFAAERRAVQTLASRILSSLREEKPVTVCAYSQGTVICKDALELARNIIVKRKGQQAWIENAARISVISIGAANHLWRPELKSVTSYRVINDFVPRLTLPIAKVLSFLKRDRFIFVEPSLVSPVDMNLRSGGHSFLYYLGTLRALLKFEKINRHNHSASENN